MNLNQPMDFSLLVNDKKRSFLLYRMDLMLHSENDPKFRLGIINLLT
jgi:hypothetical protein